MNKYILFCIVTSISFLFLQLPINPSLSASTLLYCIATGVCAYFVTAHYAPKSKTSKLEQHLQDIKQEVKETKKTLEQEKTLQNKNLDISIISSTQIPKKIFKDRSDKKFGKELFKIAVKDDKNIQDLINEYTPEWDNDRIAVIDMIILKMCINEFTSFPSIPVKVSINEYVEISKEYSSPNSSTFINGVLNNIYRKLDKEGMINKNERGSQ